MTNFAIFIEMAAQRAPIAQRGKAKRNAPTCGWSGWRWLGTRDGRGAVISHAYPGDRPDVTQFTRSSTNW